MEECGEEELSAFVLAERWAEASKSVDRKREKLAALEEELERNTAYVLGIKKHLQDTVDAKRPRRVFDIGDCLVLVERYKLSKRKYKAGTVPPPDQYGVRVDLIEVEKK